MYRSVKKIIAINDYRIQDEFDNHEQGVLNMASYLDFGIFNKLKDPDVFNTARVSFDTVEWANGIDLNPEFVYDKCAKVPLTEEVSDATD